MANETEVKLNVLEKLINWMIASGQEHLDSYINHLKYQSPGLSRDDLAHKVVNRKSFKNGLVGAATGLGGLITLPVAVPADLVASWKIQITLALAVARVYDHTRYTTDFKTDIYLILAGNSAVEALKRAGIEVSKGVTKKAISKYVTREVMKKIWKVIPQKVITKAGEKSFTSFMKMVPLVGAPVGFAFDWAAARAVGKTAIHYYSGR